MNEIFILPKFLRKIQMMGDEVLITSQNFNKIKENCYILQVFITEEFPSFLEGNLPLVGISNELINIGSNVVYGVLIKEKNKRSEFEYIKVGVMSFSNPILEEFEKINKYLIHTHTPNYLFINSEISEEFEITFNQKIILKVYDNIILSKTVNYDYI